MTTNQQQIAELKRLAMERFASIQAKRTALVNGVINALPVKPAGLHQLLEAESARSAHASDTQQPGKDARIETVSVANALISSPKQPTPPTTTKPIQQTTLFSIVAEPPALPFGARVLNPAQLRAVALIASGQSCCLIGAAGTGKTTTTYEGTTELLATHRAPMIGKATKMLTAGSPGIVGIAFTRRAANNLRKQMPPQLQGNVMTFHALLEYEPVDYTIPETGKQSMRFEPQRNATNPLPDTIATILVDESSMVSVELFKVLLDALAHPVQFIFIGDIQQLAPVFGEAILGFKLLELPTVELTHVYRQALESPIIRLAHRVLSGKPITVPELSSDWQHPGQLTIARWPANTSPERAENIAMQFLETKLKEGSYNPEEDMVLIPFNKHFGTIRVARRIAGLVDSHTVPPRKVIEVIAGFNRHYFAAGDRLLHINEEVKLEKLVPNPTYKGKLVSRNLEFSRFGGILGVGEAEGESWLEQSIDEVASAAEEGVVDDASHILYLTYEDGRKAQVKSRGAVNNLVFSYCTTFHKAQGLQAPRVFLLLHKQHDIMVSRELLYTGITRAQHSLTIICDNSTFLGGVVKQQVKGTTLAEKAEYFKGKQSQYQEKLA